MTNDDHASPIQPTHHHALRLLTLSGLLLGFALRLYRLGAESLWYDETVSVVLAQKSIPALIRHTAGDIHPPGYYLLLHAWQAFMQPTPAFGLEFLYAWPSLFCGMLIMGLLFALGRTFTTPDVAVSALWLAAINPYHIWYSQEVRMYTLGALLGLMCLWAMLQWWCNAAGRRWQRYSWLGVYIIAGATGLYTLYYFLFTLVACNVIAFLLWAWQRHQRIRPATSGMLLRWLGAQIALLLLWAPWLPVFWRQATDPPVPPWRTLWTTGAQLLAASAESASALLSGQSAPAATAWWWAPVFLVILLAAYQADRKAKFARGELLPNRRPGLLVLTGYLLIPIILIYAITLWLTPLYHVRYLFIYAPPLLLLLALALHYAVKRQRVVGSVALIAVIACNSWSLVQFWFAPAFQADDHRAAVALVAAAWRPGDAILVNAGWAYTALRTYWPTVLAGADAATPPPLPPMQRLIDYKASERAERAGEPPAPTVVRTGSVEGAPTLGWGDPSSDFFAMNAVTANKALFTLAQDSHRIWHYRIYDTVSDPAGLIRTWFDYYNTGLAEMPFPGRDYLLVQLYETAQASSTAVNGFVPLDLTADRFAGDLHLVEAALAPQTVEAGSYLYTHLVWQPPVNRTKLPAVVSLSLRLYTAEGHLLAQADETPPLPIQRWPAAYAVTLALPIPVATPPGAHNLDLIAYDQQNGEPLAVVEPETTAIGPLRQVLPLGTLSITPASRAPIVTDVAATFDYIDLVRARLTTPSTLVATPLEVELVWRPRANAYRDTYVAELVLENEAGVVAGRWEAALGGWHYPSGEWPPLIPVRDWRFLPLGPATPPGHYQLLLRVRRHSDQQRIQARQNWWRTTDEIVIGEVQVE